MKAALELHLTCAEGREVECAKHLAANIQGPHWKILVALAAEILQEAERRTAGSAVVLVTGPSEAARVLRDLKA